MRFLAASLIALAAMLGGCATVTRGTTTQFTVSSSPPAAEVRTSTGYSCAATPCSLIVPRKDSFVVTVSKPGYRPVDTAINSNWSAPGTLGFLGNALIGGLLGAGVDLYTGATKDLSANPLQVDLAALGFAAVDPGTGPVVSQATIESLCGPAKAQTVERYVPLKAENGAAILISCRPVAVPVCAYNCPAAG